MLTLLRLPIQSGLRAGEWSPLPLPPMRRLRRAGNNRWPHCLGFHAETRQARCSDVKRLIERISRMIDVKATISPDGMRYLLLIPPFVLGNLIVAITLPSLNQLLFLDMWATAIASLLGGPWYGALVGCLTNVAGEMFFGRQYLNFAPVSVCGGLIWGALAHRGKLGPFFSPDQRVNIYRRLTGRILLNGLVVGISSTLLAVAILSSFTGWVPIPSFVDAGKEHPAVLILRIFYDYFEKTGLGQQTLIDADRSQMAAVLNIPGHLLTTVPDKLFSASLAFCVAICIARRSAYAQWQASKVLRSRQLHIVFSPALFTVCYFAVVFVHFFYNLPALRLSTAFEVVVWMLPLIVAVVAIWRELVVAPARSRVERPGAAESSVAFHKLVENMERLHYDLFDLYVVAYAIGLFTVFAYYTNDDVVAAIRQVFEKGIGVFTLLVLLKVGPVFVSHLIRDK
jgi:hypothetical protein